MCTCESHLCLGFCGCLKVPTLRVSYFFQITLPQKKHITLYVTGSVPKKKMSFWIELEPDWRFVSDMLSQMMSTPLCTLLFVCVPIECAKWSLTIKDQICSGEGLCCHNLHQRWDSIIHQRKCLLGCTHHLFFIIHLQKHWRVTSHQILEYMKWMFKSSLDIYLFFLSLNLMNIAQ